MINTVQQIFRSGRKMSENGKKWEKSKKKKKKKKKKKNAWHHIIHRTFEKTNEKRQKN